MSLIPYSVFVIENLAIVPGEIVPPLESDDSTTEKEK
jgi:hypothetical protein